MCNKAKVGAYANVSPFSGDLLGDSRMSNVLFTGLIQNQHMGACMYIYLSLVQNSTFAIRKVNVGEENREKCAGCNFGQSAPGSVLFTVWICLLTAY